MDRLLWKALDGYLHPVIASSKTDHVHFDRSFLGLQILLDAFFTRDSFFVIGAGVSAPQTPMTAELSETVVTDFLNAGVFSTKSIEPSALVNRVIQKPPIWQDPMLYALIQRLPPGFAQASVLRQLAPSLGPIPPQYAVFNLACAPATIFNMNTDGLARKFCRNHLILEPHGSGPTREVLDGLDWSDLMDSYAMYPELRPLSLPSLVLPGPEPDYVTKQDSYAVASARLRSARHVAIIGYSFGGYDDSHTYTFLVERLRLYRPNVVIVSPNPRDLVECLSENMKSNRVFGVEAYWKPLATAILNPGECQKSHLPSNYSVCDRCVWYRYAHILDCHGETALRSSQCCRTDH